MFENSNDLVEKIELIVQKYKLENEAINCIIEKIFNNNANIEIMNLEGSDLKDDDLAEKTD